MREFAVMEQTRVTVAQQQLFEKNLAIWTFKAHLMSEVQYLKIAQRHFFSKTFLKKVLNDKTINILCKIKILWLLNAVWCTALRSN